MRRLTDDDVTDYLAALYFEWCEDHWGCEEEREWTLLLAEVERRHYHGGPACVCMHCMAAAEYMRLLEREEEDGRLRHPAS